MKTIKDLEQYRAANGKIILPFGLDLSGADLFGSDLSWAKLVGANLRRADLEGSKLIGSDLSGVNLVGSDLSGANLVGSDLVGANLVGANLVGSDLEGSDLNEVDLFGADLRGSKLEGIKNKEILTFQYGQHFAYYCDGHIKIGCICKPLDYWKENFESVGKEHEYTQNQIETYGDFIMYCYRKFK